MNVALLQRLKHKTAEVDAFPYAHIAVECAEVRAGGESVTIRAREVAGAPFEAHELDVTSDSCVESVGQPDRVIAFDLPVSEIALLRRQEWIEAFIGDPGDVVGSNPVTIATGPVGTAPLGAPSVTIVSAIMFGTGDGDEQVLLYLSDYAGLLDVTSSVEEIGAYLRGVTTEKI